MASYDDMDHAVGTVVSVEMVDPGDTVRMDHRVDTEGMADMASYNIFCRFDL